MSRLVHKAPDTFTSFEVSDDKKSVAIFYATGELQTPLSKIAEFSMEEVWDMIRDALLLINVGPLSNPGLFRRKGEAVAGTLYTNKTYAGGKDYGI